MRRQVDLTRTQQQIATGRSMLSAADNPLAAGSAVTIDRSIAALERFGQNANVLANRLNLQESSLAEAGDAMHRLRELTIQALNSVLSDSDRVALASEVVEIRKQLVAVANSVDAEGRFLFGGSLDDRKPFVDGPGGISYVGDQIQRSIEVAPEMPVADAAPGSEVWMRVPTGTGRIAASTNPANTGSALLANFSLTDAVAWNQQSFTVRFTSPNNYDLVDSLGATVFSGPFPSGDTLSISGLSIKIDGVPAAGDEFNIGPSVSRDLFATVDALAAALNQPTVTGVERTRQQNKLAETLNDISSAQDHLIDKRAAGGARMATVEDAIGLREAQVISLKEILSSYRDVNMAEAISEMTQKSAALEAAQATFMRIQGLSLFNFLR